MSTAGVARHGFVSGVVQGVAFRYYALDQAGHRGVDGWIRNCPDGRVEFFAQGTEPAVRAFVEWLHHGPPSARVSGVEVSAAPSDPTFTGFEVRH